MTLTEYLNKYFPNGEQGTFEDKPVDLTLHFLEKFGVDVKKENDLYQFKYNMIYARFSFPITHECRGIILRHGVEWKVVSRPYSKFFNFGEIGKCKISEEDFSPTLQIIEKCDGTCISCWYDDVYNKWRASTLGTISTMAYDQAFRPNDTFENLFLKTIGKIDWEKFDPAYTYLFELCSHDNRIVTCYSKDIVYLIAAREKNHGLYLNDQAVDILCSNLQENGSNVKRPALHFFYEYDFKDFNDVLAWVEKESENDKYGHFPEGFVIYRGGIPVAKMKNKKYLAAFHVSGGNKGHAKNAIIEAIFIGNIDDVYDMMIPELQDFANSIKEKVARLGLEVMEVGNKMSGVQYPTQKDYALAVQRNCTTRTLQSFFYQNKEAIIAGKNLSELYTSWITDNYKRFLDLWKVKEEA